MRPRLINVGRSPAIAVERLDARRLLDGAAAGALPAAELTHTTASVLDVAGAHLATVALDGKAFFAGGNTGIYPSDGVAVYDSATGAWTSGRLPHAGRTSAVAIGHKAFFVGGDGGPNVDDGVADVYDDETGQWSSLQLPSPCRDKAFAAGGTAFFPNARGTAYNALDVATGNWRTVQAPNNLGAAFIGALGGQPSFFGSTGGGVRLYVYDAVRDEFSSTRLPVPSFAVYAAVAVGSRVVLADTEYGDGAFIYDSVTGRTQRLIVPSGLRLTTPPVVLGDKLLFDNTYRGDSGGIMAVYDAASDAWSQTALGRERQDMGVATVGRQAIFAGGDLVSYNPVPDVDIFTDQSPAPLLSGTVAAHRGTATVTVTNTGDADYSGPYVVQVYATPPHRLKGAVLLGSVALDRHLAPGASVRVAVPLSVPAGVAAGTYHYVAAVAQASDPSHPTPVAGGTATFRLGGPSAAATRVSPDATPFSRVPLRDAGSPASLFANPRRRRNGY